MGRREAEKTEEEEKRRKEKNGYLSHLPSPIFLSLLLPPPSSLPPYLLLFLVSHLVNTLNYGKYYSERKDSEEE